MNYKDTYINPTGLTIGEVGVRNQQAEISFKAGQDSILELLPEISERFDHNKACFDCVEIIKRKAQTKRMGT